jgi:hypothetical protein
MTRREAELTELALSGTPVKTNHSMQRDWDERARKNARSTLLWAQNR